MLGCVLLNSATSVLKPAAPPSVPPCHTVIVVWPFLVPPAGAGPLDPLVLAPLPLLPHAVSATVTATRGRRMRMRRFIVSLPLLWGQPSTTDRVRCWGLSGSRPLASASATAPRCRATS